MPKRVVISGYYGFENFGDELILTVLLGQLKAWECIPLVLSEHPHDTKTYYHVDSVHRLDFLKILDAIEGSSAFISGGGGLFQDVTGPMSPLYYGGLIQLAHSKNKPVGIFGQGVGPLHGGLSQWVTGRAFKQAGFIAVRDRKSQLLVEQLTEKTPYLMADPVWLWESDPRWRNVEQKAIGVSLRPWPQLTDDTLDHIAKTLSQIPQIEQLGVFLLDCQSGSDIIPLAKLEHRLNILGIPVQWHRGLSLAQGFAQCSMVLAMRFHAVLMAALFNIPTISISYDPKVQQLASLLKITDIPIHMLSELLSATTLREKLHYPNQTVVAELKANAQKGFDQLRTWLDV